MDDQSMRMLADPQHRVAEDEFVPTLTVRGSNTPLLTANLRIGRDTDGVQVSTIS